MRADRVAVLGTAVAIVALTLATGPAVGIIQIPAGGVSEGPSLGSGSADVTVLSAPDTATLRAGDYGDVHYLSVPPATVSTTNLTGAPVLTASVDVDGLGYSRSTVFVLDSTGPEERSLEIERGSLDSSEIERSTYSAQYRLVLVVDSGRTVVTEAPVTVEVNG